MSEMRFTTTVLSEPEIRVYISDWKGAPVLHIRKFVDTEKYSGPTKQGVMTPIDNVMELIVGILSAYEQETGIVLEVSEPKDDSE